LADFRIAETENFQKKMHSLKYKALYGKIFEFVYPILRKNPYFGPNIKKLKGEFQDLYRYRLGAFRLFYSIREDEVIVFIVDIEARKDAYK